MTFTDPIGAGLVQGRTDQGVDYTGKGPLYALGSGTVVNTHNSGWPGLGTFIAIKLDDTSGLSDYVYYAEDITPAVRVGQRVSAGQLVGTATGGSTGIEVGWAQPPGSGAALAGGATGATSQGQNFFNLVKSLGGIGGKGSVTNATTTGFNPLNALNPAEWAAALEKDLVVNPVNKLWNWLLNALGVKSLTDLLERGALIIFGAILVIMGLISITNNSSSGSPVANVQESKTESKNVAQKESNSAESDATSEADKI